VEGRVGVIDDKGAVQPIRALEGAGMRVVPVGPDLSPHSKTRYTDIMRHAGRMNKSLRVEVCGKCKHHMVGDVKVIDQMVHVYIDTLEKKLLL
jgi:hypothetical protein